MNQANSTMTEFQESQTVTLEWTVRNLKQLFENSKGEQKSKVVKSAIFGGGCSFIPIADTKVEGISACTSHPTSDEKEKAMNGKWQREGLYKFTFELRSINKGTSFNTKEAYNHAFSWKTANWGWAQFARRDAVYYAPNTVRMQDAFVIVCQITSSPSAPVSNMNVQSVPRSLMASVGSLLDDPIYSDVEFIIPPRRRGGKSKKIWASKRLLSGRYMNAHDDSDEEDAELDDITWEVTSDAGIIVRVEDVETAPLIPVPSAKPQAPAPVIPGPSKTPVVVRDVAYVTYKLYTDTIVFAPLKSQFLVSSPSASFAQALQLPISSDGAPMNSPGIGIMGRSDSRRGWLKNWEANYPDRPVPCSAKAIYRLADSEFASAY
ncbi:hypothetical protein AG1IA_07507 [Rhizoctonia solani AG-1 IA]|uniref:MATH domain-containing protein n=1 Tax=Thanatephorus cucumeris (strain AG1-IA) TaxID=983506 RepID=L8WNW6_THACA|nr:hypothetical protein AG1IA_07507 [Rhizoctonia solani AG-1 IA]